MSIAAACAVADAIKANPDLTLCLPAGTTPTGTYRELMQLQKTQNLDFSHITFFYLDEFVGLADDHPESFRTYLNREVFQPGRVLPAQIHAPDLNYEETIRSCGGIDLLLCGIGANGHIAFNEPGSLPDSRTRIVSLAESTLHRLQGKFKPEEMPRQAITMGLATILEAREILLLASGPEKASILARATVGPITTDVPASVLQLHPNCTVITDQAISS